MVIYTAALIHMRNTLLKLSTRSCVSCKFFLKILQTMSEKQMISSKHTSETRHIKLKISLNHTSHIVLSQTVTYTRGKKWYPDFQMLMEKIDVIAKEATDMKRSYHIEHPAPRRAIGDVSSRQGPNYGTKTVGFDEYLLKLKDHLCGEPGERRIISILGMGRIGKTTLAKTIFDDSLIAYHFDVRAWITVSQKYCMYDILSGLLSELSAMTDNLSKASDGVLAEHVYKSLKGRRYLIIMDDIWSTKTWDDMRRILPNDNNGSRVIITSRLSEVAYYADPSSPLHHMQLLDEDESWNLLKEKVFEQECCPPELEKIGKNIAERCRGLPLTIVLAAGLLSKIVRTVNDWEKFAANVRSTRATNDEHLFNVIFLSYNNLPHHLRDCFLYMGSFPEDHEIPVSKLTKLWTAEGFLKPMKYKSMEEVAEEYVVDLVKRNLISISKKRSNGRIKFCLVHDLLRDFCIQKAEDENFLHVSTSQEGIESKRRLSSFMMDPIPSNSSGPLVRSVLLFNRRYIRRLSISFRLLRVFSGTNVCLDLLHPAVTELFHLRYLSFSYHRVDFSVPASISELRNLQTLIIRPQYRYISRRSEWLRIRICLPFEIWKMPKLKHILLHTYCVLPIHFDKEIGGKTLKNLQTLSKVGNFSFTREIIEMIPNLKKLGVVYYNKNLIDRPKYYLHNLRHLNQLESLHFCVALSEHSLRSHFTQNFSLPQSLKKLTLKGCGFSWQELSIVGQLPNLEVLKLQNRSAVGDEWKSLEGEFLRLKYLLMEMIDVKYWQAECTDFPSLERLILKCCQKLEEIPLEIGDIQLRSSRGGSLLEIQQFKYKKNNTAAAETTLFEFMYMIRCQNLGFGMVYP